MIRKTGIVLLLLMVIINGKSQENDFRSWFTFQVEHEFFNLLDVSVTPEIRLWDNSSRLEGFLTETDVSVPIFKLLRIGLNYRYQADFENPERSDNSNRFGVYAQVSQKAGNFRFGYRAFYNQEYTNLHTTEHGFIPLMQHRHKISVKYDKKSWELTPSVSAEMFYTISPASAANQEKLRLSAGLDYELTKKLDVGISYKFQQEFYESNPLSSHIIALEIKVVI